MAITNPTIVTINESVTDITVTGQETITVDITQSDVQVEVNNFVLPTQYQDAANVVVTPYATITATTVQAALQQLADQNFRGPTAPAEGSANLSEGDFFYDTDDDQLKVYRETSTGNFEFVPIIVGEASSNSDTVDAGAF